MCMPETYPTSGRRSAVASKILRTRSRSPGRSARKLDPSEMMQPCMIVLPMGWGHSPTLAQEAHERFQAERTGFDQTHRMSACTPVPHEGPWHFTYIDDVVEGVIRVLDRPPRATAASTSAVDRP